MGDLVCVFLQLVSIALLSWNAGLPVGGNWEVEECDLPIRTCVLLPYSADFWTRGCLQSVFVCDVVLLYCETCTSDIFLRNFMFFFVRSLLGEERRRVCSSNYVNLITLEVVTLQCGQDSGGC